MRGFHFGNSHELIWKEEFHCVGNENHLAHCPRMLDRIKACSHGAYVLCSGETLYAVYMYPICLLVNPLLESLHISGVLRIPSLSCLSCLGKAQK